MLKSKLIMIIIGVVILGAIFSLLIAFGQLEIVVGGALLGALFSLVAVGLNLQYGVTRVLNVAHGEFLMVGAFVTYYFFSSFGVNPVVSLVISGPVVFLIGILVQLVIFRRIVHTSRVVEELESRSLLACFGLMFIIQNVIAQIFTGNVKIVNWGNEPVAIGGELFGLNTIMAAVISVIISVLMYLLLRFTRVGLAMRATVEEPAGAQLVGIDTLKIHAVTFGLGALLAALAGSMLITMYNFTPYLPGPWYTSFALAVIILGGMGSFIGSMLGGFFVGYVYYSSLTVSGLIAVPVVYICIMLLLLVKPKGFFGR